MEKKFCQGCKKRLLMLGPLGDRTMEFEDGFYCEKCAKVKVEKNRRNL